LAYQAPGVYIEDYVIGNPSSFSGSIADRLAIVGATEELTSYQEIIQVILSPNYSFTFAMPFVEAATIAIKNYVSGETYTLVSDYTITQTTNSYGEIITTLAIPEDSHITSGMTLQLTYNYNIQDYFTPRYFTNARDVIQRYGNPFNLQDQINSPLSLAAQIAFNRGLPGIWLVPVKKDSVSGLITQQALTEALAKIVEENTVSTVALADGTQTFHQTVLQHVNEARALGHERRAILGVDGSSSTIPLSQLKSYATSLSSTLVGFTATTWAKTYSQNTNRPITLGGQYVAIEDATIATLQSPSEPLTRKTLSYFYEVQSYSTYDSDDLTSNGCIVHEAKNSQIRIRHGVTTDTTNILTMEWTPQGEKDRLLQELKAAYEAEKFIGSPMTEYSIAHIESITDSVLTDLTNRGIIRGAEPSSAYPDERKPTNLIVEVIFTVLWPINTISLRIGVDTSTGQLSIGA
jgi:hypothetical protein